MGRRSSRPHVASTSTTPQKRPSSPTRTAVEPPSQRPKRRASGPPSSQTTGKDLKKSKYFEPESESESEESAVQDDEEDEYQGSEMPLQSEDSDEDSEQFSEDDKEPRKKKGRQGYTSKQNNDQAAKDMDLWKPGVKTGLGPGKEVVIRLPKAREAGKTPYRDDTIHPNTLLFLTDLARNNNREWLKMHDADFRTSEKDFDSFAAALTEQLIERDDTIPELPVKDIKFRIYRDIRFSPDPTPYKAYFSAAWSRTGRKGPYAHYYVHVQPGKSFVGGGLWHAEAQPLALLRRNIDRKPHKIKQILTDANIRKSFLGGIPNDAKKATKKFVELNQEDALKTKPKGFSSDNPNLDLLRLRSLTVRRSLKDDEVLGKKGLQTIADLLGDMTPFITYLNSVVMPDDPPSDESGEESDGTAD